MILQVSLGPPRSLFPVDYALSYGPDHRDLQNRDGVALSIAFWFQSTGGKTLLPLLRGRLNNPLERCHIMDSEVVRG